MIEQGPQGEAKSALKMIDEGLRKQQTDNSKQSSDDELKEAARLLGRSRDYSFERNLPGLLGRVDLAYVSTTTVYVSLGRSSI